MTKLKEFKEKITVNKSLIVKYTGFISAIIIVFLIPTYVWYIPPFMILLGISWILEKKDIPENGLFKKYKLPIVIFILFLSFYLWQLAGIAYSPEKSTGLRFFLSRLSLFLFPLVLAIPGEKIKTNVITLLRIFALATILYIISCYGYAFFRSVSLNNSHLNFNSKPPEAFWTSYFYGFYFSFSQHTSYLSIYVILSIFIAFESWFDKNLKISKRLLWLLTALILMLSIYNLSSRTGIIVLILSTPSYLLIKFWKRLKFLVASVILAATILLAFIVVRTNPRTSVLIDGASSGTLKAVAVKDGRPVIWKAAMNQIKRNLVFGVGTGGVDAVMRKEYLRIGNQEFLKGRFNLHNEYLEILLENGLIGLLLFTAMICAMIFAAISQKNLLYGIFLLSMLIFFLFETVLNRLPGVSFFSLFSFLLLYIPESSFEEEIIINKQA